MLDEWLSEAISFDENAKNGMYLFHVGTVRATARKQVRENIVSDCVISMDVRFDNSKVLEARAKALRMDGVSYVRIAVNEGKLRLGGIIMTVLVCGDTRPHVMAAMDSLLCELKTVCITEHENFRCIL
ncbi:MAG: molybdenum cofactor biosynthesis protein MoaE [Sphaerochaeta sp.]